MKHAFRLTRVNLIYAAFASVILLVINLGINGTGSLGIATSVGAVIGTLIVPVLFAVLFWFVLGRKENGGTLVFNIVLTLVLINSLIQVG